MSLPSSLHSLSRISFLVSLLGILGNHLGCAGDAFSEAEENTAGNSVGGDGGTAGQAGSTQAGESGASGQEEGGAGNGGEEQGGAGEGGSTIAGQGGEAGVGGEAGNGGTGDAGGEAGAGGSTTAGQGGAGQGGDEPGGAGQGGNGQGGTGQGGTDGGAGGVAPSVCGDGKITGDEQCDDGGQNNNDGCSTDCKVVCSDIDKNAKLNPENNHCYWILNNNTFDKSWSKSKDLCTGIRRHLVTISSEVENKFLQKFYGSDSKQNFWIGLSDGKGLGDKEVGVYKWITGKPVTYQKWAPGEPNAAENSCGLLGGKKCYEHRAIRQNDGTWNDVREDGSNDAICEWEPPGL